MADTRSIGKKEEIRLLIIPDTQIKPGVSTDHITWIAQAVKAYKPDHVVMLGDWWDMSSLSTYTPKRLIEGQRILSDIEAGNEAMRQFWKPLKRLKNRPEFHFHFGNHENRLTRYTNDHPEISGILGDHLFYLDGWKTHPFLAVNEIGGIHFSHYFYNPMSGRPWAGNCHNVLRNVGLSFTQGHRQGKDLASRTLPNGRVQRGCIAGSCYLHSEGYLGPQGKESWHGVLIYNEVKDGNYDLLELSLRYLCKKFTGKKLEVFL